MQDLRPPLGRRDIEQLQEIVIRAHYLALELREMCAPSGVAEPELSRQVGVMLQRWAIAFGGAIERIEPTVRRGRRG